uniref:Uncharacterized protein n=1 Tax=Romanomermis culicivorax TaxID=13658 RepID=A0A915IIB1_ROMCU
AVPCTLFENQRALEECLKPLNESWSEILRQKPQLKLLTFGALQVEPNELKSSICPKYLDAQARCGSLLQQCAKENGAALWAIQMFGHACRRGSDYDSSGQCLWTVSSAQQQCLLLLRKAGSGAAADGLVAAEKNQDCRRLYQFYKCLEKLLQQSCKAKGLAALVHLIENYGCDTAEVETDELRNSEKRCQLEDESAIDICFQPLTQLWDETLRQDQTGLLSKTNFPLYYFKNGDVTRMCDLVEVLKDECPPIRQCPSHRLPQFANALLGVACGTKQQQFLTNYDCLRRTLNNNARHCAQLIPGVWSPSSGKHKELCLRLPQYFACVKEHISSTCTKSDFEMFVQTLKQYGCATDDLDLTFSPSTKKPQVAQFGQEIGLREIIASVDAFSSPFNANGDANLAAQLESSQPTVKKSSTVADVKFAKDDSSTAILRQKQSLAQLAVGAPSATQKTQSKAGAALDFKEKLKQKNVKIEKFVDDCDVEKQRAVRACLEPLFTHWSEVHRQRRLGNLTFALYHYKTSDLLDLCDLYASAFLICPFGQFHGCLRDKAVFAANSLLGYVCSPQNVGSFMNFHPCLARAIKDNEPRCPTNENKTSDFGDTATKCSSIRQFFDCNAVKVELSCGQEAADAFQEKPVIVTCRHAESRDLESSLALLRPNSTINLLTIDDAKFENFTNVQQFAYKIFKLRLRNNKFLDLDNFLKSKTILDYLIELDLSQNNLTYTPNVLNYCFKKLKLLNLAKNRIRSFEISDGNISQTTVKSSLIGLDLSWNFLTKFDASEILFENLRDLNLAGNNLTEIPDEFFKMHNNSLLNLNLASNRISNIQNLEYLNDLKSLNLEFNNLTSLDGNFLGENNQNLNYLYLLGNKLPGWNSNLCKNLPNLRTLSISSPHITELAAGALTHCKNLIRFEMPHGFLEYLNENAFEGAKNLYAVLLNNNRLKKLFKGTFFGLTNVYSIDLSGNQISVVEDGTFAELPNLKHLDLSFNRLKTLEPHTFDGSFINSPKMLASLYLCENHWICDEYLDWMRKWTRENMEINLDKSMSCVSLCSAPDHLENWPIRFPNPPDNTTAENITSILTTKQEKISETSTVSGTEVKNTQTVFTTIDHHTLPITTTDTTIAGNFTSGITETTAVIETSSSSLYNTTIPEEPDLINTTTESAMVTDEIITEGSWSEDFYRSFLDDLGGKMKRRQENLKEKERMSLFE